MATQFPLGKRYATDAEGNKTKKVYPVVRYFNAKNQSVESTKLNFPLDSQSIGKNHQRQIYNFSDDSPLVKLINEAIKIREANLNESSEFYEAEQALRRPYTFEEVEDFREEQLRYEMENATDEDLYKAEQAPTEVNKGADFVQSGEERKNLCK